MSHSLYDTRDESPIGAIALTRGSRMVDSDENKRTNIPCTCDLTHEQAQAIVARAPIWLVEHWMARKCPRHDPLPRYEERIRRFAREEDE